MMSITCSRRTAILYGKYNPGQKAMYTGWLVMAIIQIITGFILYKTPSSFRANRGLPGGDIAIRMVTIDRNLISSSRPFGTMYIWIYLKVSRY